MKDHFIVIVEDNVGDVELLEEAFRDAQLTYHMTVLNDGEKAMHFLEDLTPAHPVPDLFIIDINMPKVDGITVLQTLKTNPHTAHCTVLIMTSAASPRDQKQVDAVPGTMLQLKPASLDAFLQVGLQIKELLETPPAAS